MNYSLNLQKALRRRKEEGMSSDEELRLLLEHYTPLETLLYQNVQIDDTYRLVWFDVKLKLDEYQLDYRSRVKKRLLPFTIDGKNP